MLCVWGDADEMQTARQYAQVDGAWRRRLRVTCRILARVARLYSILKPRPQCAALRKHAHFHTRCLIQQYTDLVLVASATRPTVTHAAPPSQRANL